MAKILIVDDSFFIRRSIKTLLVQAGHSVVGEASDGREAIDKYAKIIPDLVTMDLTMRGMCGIEAIEQILSKYPEAKIIVVSALNEKTIVFEALERGAKNYIFKPIYGEKLILVVNSVLND